MPLNFLFYEIFSIWICLRRIKKKKKKQNRIPNGYELDFLWGKFDVFKNEQNWV